jgi:hypothetical protein
MSEYIEHDKEGISVGLVEKKLFTFAEPPDEMLLENGAKLSQTRPGNHCLRNLRRVKFG